MEHNESYTVVTTPGSDANIRNERKRIITTGIAFFNIKYSQIKFVNEVITFGFRITRDDSIVKHERKHFIT